MANSRATRPPVLQAGVLFALICAAPLLAFYSENVHEQLNFGRLAGYWLMLVAAATLVYQGLAFVFRSRTAWLASVWAVLLFVLFSYIDVLGFLGELGFDRGAQRLGWIVFGSVALLLAVLLGARRGFQQFLFVFALLSLVSPLWLIFSLWRELPSQGPALPLAEAYPLEGNAIWSGVALRKPNIYWILADSYPNLAELGKHYAYDNTPFLEALEARGFYVAREAHSNYSDTRLSVPAMLNMEYPFLAGENYATPIGRGWAPNPGKTNRGTVAAVVGDNRAVGFLRQLGYRYVHFEGRSFNLTRCRGFEDLCLRIEGAGFSELDVSLLQRVPTDLFVEWVLRMPPGTRPRPMPHESGTGIPELGSAIEALEIEGPFFLYAHLSVPHAPFLVDEDCRVGALLVSRRSFSRQLRCVNEQLLGLVDQIQKADPEAIVLLSGDHGPRMTIKPGTPLFRWNAEQIRESLGILNALYLPAECRRGLHPGLTPVNDMRIVFACLGGHGPRLLPEEHFVARGGPPDGGKIRRVTLK